MRVRHPLFVKVIFTCLLLGGCAKFDFTTTETENGTIRIRKLSSAKFKPTDMYVTACESGSIDFVLSEGKTSEDTKLFTLSFSTAPAAGSSVTLTGDQVFNSAQIGGAELNLRLRGPLADVQGNSRGNEDRLNEVEVINVKVVAYDSEKKTAQFEISILFSSGNSFMADAIYRTWTTQSCEMVAF